MSIHRHITLSMFAGPWIGAFAVFGLLLSAPTLAAAQTINGQVLGAGAPIAGSTVTLWAAGAAISRLDGRGWTRLRLGRAMPRNSRPTADRSHL
jgi:hypothetical protein